MFLHVLMMQLNDAAGAEFHGQVQAYCDRVRAECEGVRQYEYSVNVASRAKAYTHVIVSVFESSKLHDTYQASTVHQAMKGFMMPFIEDLVVFDGELPDREAPSNVRPGGVSE